MTSAQGPVPPDAGGPSSLSPLPPDLQAANASKADRTMAMVGHLVALVGLVFPFGNIIGPLVVWLVKKDQSRFVAFHAKQSMFFQIAVTVVVVAIMIISIPLAFICVGYLTMLLAAGAGLAALVYAVIGGIQVNSGKDFEYYFIGPWVRKSL